MYKVLVADKEIKYANMINKYTEKNTFPFKVVKHVDSGLKLIEQAKILEPDIIFLDVDINDYTGVEAAKQIRKFNKNVHIVFMTKYEYKDFIYAAMEVGAKAFIKKPAKNEEIKNVLKELSRTIAEERKTYITKQESDRALKERKKYTEYSFIYSLLVDTNYTVTVGGYLNELNLKTEGYIMNIELKIKNKDKTEYIKKISDELYKCIKKTISRKYTCAVGAIISRRITVYICESFQETVMQEESAAKIATEVANDLQKILGISATIGSGSVRPIQKIHLSYEEALRSLRYKNEDNQKIMHIYNTNPRYKGVHKSYFEIERMMLDCLRVGREQTLDYFSDLLDILDVYSLSVKKNKIIENLILICHETSREEPGENIFTDYFSYFEELKYISEEELKAWAIQKIQYIIKQMKTRKIKPLPDTILEAIKYIDNNYMNNIQLEDVSNKVGLTPQYFSTFFKEELQCTYVDYLTKMRMEKAKELIFRLDGSIQQICYKVGYHDPNYFSRIFKKYTGYTPTEYKKNMDVEDNK